MTIPVTNVESTQTFGAWLEATNRMARLFSQNTVTSDGTSAGSITSGNSYVNGFFGSRYLYANAGLVGGNLTSNTALSVLSNTHFVYGSANLVTITSNGTSSNTTITTNTVFIQPSAGGNTIISGNNLNVNTNLTNVTSTNTNVNSSVLITGNTTVKANSAHTTLTITGSGSGVQIFANTSNTTVVGNVFFSNTLQVSNTSAFIGNATFSNSVIITGNATFSNQVTIAGNVNFSNTIAVTGNATFNNTVTFNSSLTFSNTITVIGNATFSNTIAVTGNAVFSNAIAVTGNTTLSNTIAVTGNATFSNLMSVAGVATFNGNAVTGSSALFLFNSTTHVYSGSYSFATSSAATIDTVATATYRSVEYLIQMTDTVSLSYHMTKFMVVHDGTTPYKTEFGTIFTNASVGTVDATISGGNINLRVTPASATVVVKFIRTAIVV